MILGYDDHGPRPRLCHMPLRHLLTARRHARDLRSPRKRREWGKVHPAGGCLANWPYSLVTGNGHRPFG